MSGREDFERRLDASVREFVETAPKEIDAARLTHALATSTPRVRRLVPRPALRLPSLGLAWIPVAAVLAAALLGMGLLAAGAFRDVRSGPATPVPSSPLATPPAVIASPFASMTPAPTAAPSPLPSARPSPSGQPQAVVFTSWMVISATGPNTGTFDATGPASARGLVCPHGTVTDLVVVDPGAIARGDYTVPKTFTCDDGSGAFVLELQVRVEKMPGTESLEWRVLRGTGAYAHMQGAGTGTTMTSGPGQVVNTLTGSVVN